VSDPTRAISIIQPWAWLISRGIKPVENRTWLTKFRGPVYIHASKRLSLDEYFKAWSLLHSVMPGELTLPVMSSLPRGALVGVANITDCVTEHSSPWFFGPYGFVMEDARAIPPIPMKGRLGVWRIDNESQ